MLERLVNRTAEFLLDQGYEVFGMVRRSSTVTFDRIAHIQDRVTLVHADNAALRRMAVFDVLINNADRKGGHILSATDGHIYGVDHGVSMHVEDKLRTVLWGWAGKPVDDETLETVARLRDEVRGTLCEQLREHLTRHEVSALGRRAAALLEDPVMPSPDRHRPIPWPAF